MDRWSRRKATVVFGGAFVVFAALLVRLYDLQIIHHAAYAATSERQGEAIVGFRGARGLILSKDGRILAISVARPSIAVDPSKVLDRVVATAKLSQALHLEPADVDVALNRRVRFAWLKRFAGGDEVEGVRRLRIPGVLVMTEYDRVYPEETRFAHVLGIVNHDDRGTEGLEGAQDRWMRGGVVRTTVLVDALRRKLEYPDVAIEGADLRLTIDARFQAIVEEELDAAIAAWRPKWASVVALDPKTGAVLAMASRPTFDPNRPALAGVAAAPRRNLAITDPYEPGSTFKPFVVAWALDRKLVTPLTKIDCENGQWKYGPRTLHDHHSYGMLTVTEIVSHSSNIGAIKIGATVLGKTRLQEAVSAFGFGSRSGIDLPAEEDGIVTPASRWSLYTLTSVPMGHEIAVTPLQMASAMAVFANGGKLMRPYVVASGEPKVVREVIGSKTCDAMKSILAEVMKSGTGKEIKVEGVTLAGKTGTTQKLDRRGTRYGYISSFAGFAPVEDPKVVIAVVVDEPQGAYYGSAVAAPVFANIVRRGWVFLP